MSDVPFERQEPWLRTAQLLLDELEATTVYLRVTAAQSLPYTSALRVERRAARRCAQLLAVSGLPGFELPIDDATDELLAGDVRRRDPSLVRQTTASQLYTSEPLVGPGGRHYEPFDDGPEGAADDTADMNSEELVAEPSTADLIALPAIELPPPEDEVEEEDTAEVLRQAERAAERADDLRQMSATPLTETRTPGPRPRSEPSYVTFDPEPPAEAEGLPEDGLEELELDASDDDEGPDTFDLVPDNDDTEPAVVARRAPAPTVARAPIGASVNLREPDEVHRPRAAAIQINPSGSGGKVLGLEEEEEPIEIGAAEDEENGGEIDLAEGFSVSMQPAEELELDDSEESEESEDEDENVEPMPAVAPAKPTKEETDAILAKARQSATEGRLQQGADLFSDVIDADPDNVDAHVARGRLYLDLGDYSRAMSDFMVAEDIAPNSPEPQVAIGDLYFARKDYRKAIDYFNAALEVSPNHAMAYCRRGISHYYRKNFREAVEDLLQAEKLNSEIPNIQTYVAMARKKVKK
jgi:Flp pilus assembly protein TadD